MGRWVDSDELLNATNVTLAASETDTVVSEVFSVTDPTKLVIDITTSGIEDTTGITGKLQDRALGGSWNDKKTVSITGTAEVHTLTFEAKASMADGEYVIITDPDGLEWAVAADLTGSSAAPTGARWVAIAAGRKSQVDLSAATDAASVAAAFEAEFDGITGFSAEITTDDTAADGTMTFTAVTAGPSITAESLLEDDAGAGGVSDSTTTAGVATGTFTIKLLPQISGDQTYLPLRKQCRVVVSTGASDAVTVSKVSVCRTL